MSGTLTRTPLRVLEDPQQLDLLTEMLRAKNCLARRRLFSRARREEALSVTPFLLAMLTVHLLAAGVSDEIIDEAQDMATESLERANRDLQEMLRYAGNPFVSPELGHWTASHALPLLTRAIQLFEDLSE